MIHTLPPLFPHISTLTALLLLLHAALFLFPRLPAAPPRFTLAPRPPPAPTIAVLVSGHTRGLFTLADVNTLRARIVAPLQREGFAVALFYCVEAVAALALPPGEDLFAGADGATGTLEFPVADNPLTLRAERAALCAANAANATRAAAYAWWVVTRPDLVLHSDVTLVGRDGGAVHARARQAFRMRNLTNLHFSYNFMGVGLCYDTCRTPPCSPCPMSRPFFMADDQFALVPAAAAPAYFGVLERVRDPALLQGCCEDCPLSLPPLFYPEGMFTRALVCGGAQLLPLALRARLKLPRVPLTTPCEVNPSLCEVAEATCFGDGDSC